MGFFLVHCVFVLFMCLHLFLCLCFVLLAHYVICHCLLVLLTLLTSAFQHCLMLFFMHCFLMFFNIAYYFFSCVTCCSSHCYYYYWCSLQLPNGVFHCCHHQNFILCTYTILTFVDVVVSYCLLMFPFIAWWCSTCCCHARYFPFLLLYVGDGHH